jgi:hypothetical protein
MMLWYWIPNNNWFSDHRSFLEFPEGNIFGTMNQFIGNNYCWNFC